MRTKTLERWLRLETSVNTTGSRSQQKQFWVPIPPNVNDGIEWAMRQLRKAECEYIVDECLHCPSGRYIQILRIDEVTPRSSGWVQVGPLFVSHDLILMIDWEMLERLISTPIQQSFITDNLDELFQALAKLPTNVESYEALVMQVGGPATYTLLEVINDLKQEVLSVNLARAIGVQIKPELVVDSHGLPTHLYTGQGVRLITFPSGNKYFAVGTGVAQTNREDTVSWRKVSPVDLTATHTSRYPKSRVWRQFNRRYGNPR